MKPILKQVITSIVIAMALTLILSFVESVLMPTFTNDMALGQLENDNVSFMAWESWSRLQAAFSYIKLGIWGICGVNIGSKIYKYNKKENN